MEKPLVSIITPCYNGEKYVHRFFQSMLSQDYDECEVIFINDGSQDNTEAIAKKYGVLLEKKGYTFLYYYQNNAGQASALQYGLLKANGKYLVWPDADDEFFPEFISKKVAYMELHPECSFCYGKILQVVEGAAERESQVLKERAKSSDSTFFEDSLTHGERMRYNGFMVRMESLDAAIPGRQIITSRGGQNLQILIPMGWYYGEPAYIDGSVYKYYIRDNSHSHSSKSTEQCIELSNSYEHIITETLKLIPDQSAKDYIPAVKDHFSTIKFSYAIDSRDKKLIIQQKKELEDLRKLTLKEFLLYIKYTLI